MLQFNVLPAEVRQDIDRNHNAINRKTTVGDILNNGRNLYDFAQKEIYKNDRANDSNMRR